MLTSKDFRIGNYLLKDGKIVEVAVINADNTIRIWNEEKTNTLGCFLLKGFEPIPLTEEWLLKLGFFNIEENPIRYFLKHDEVIILAYDIDDCCVRVSDSWEFGKRKFVHEIQNLYFALTGKELNF